MVTLQPCRATARQAYNHCPLQQRRTFLGLQRPPPPKPQMMGYLVAQGLAIILVADLGIAYAQNEPTTVRSVFQSAGLWKEPPAFERIHETGSDPAKE